MNEYCHYCCPYIAQTRGSPDLIRRTGRRVITEFESVLIRKLQSVIISNSQLKRDTIENCKRHPTGVLCGPLL